MDESRRKVYEMCRVRLLQGRQERLNGLNALSDSLSHQVSGDEGDMSSVLETQHTAMVQRDKMLRELKEIDDALRRLDEGAYGMCEETEEDIEKDRLLAIPWTRLSVAGAEIRERTRKRFVG